MKPDVNVQGGTKRRGRSFGPDVFACGMSKKGDRPLGPDSSVPIAPVLRTTRYSENSKKNDEDAA